MQAGVSEERRRPTWQPGARLGIRVAGTGLLIAALLAGGGLVQGASGVDGWSAWVALALLGLSGLGVGIAWWRSHHEVRHDWSLLVGAFACSAMAEVAFSAGASSWIDEQWPSIADAGMLGFELLLVAFFVRHVQTGNPRNFLVHIFDSLLLTLAGTFLLWELVIGPGLGDLHHHSLTTQVLVVVYTLLDVFVCSFLLLLLLVDRSPARIAAFVGTVALGVGDLLTGSVVHMGVTRLAIGAVAWVVGYIALLTAMALPSGSRVEPVRPTLPRLALVHGMVIVGLWVAAWRYVMRGEEPSVVTVVIGLSTGVLWLATLLAVYAQAGDWARRLNDTIVGLRVADEELRGLLDDLPVAVVVLDRDGRVREVNAQAVALTGLRADDIVGKYFVDLFDEHDREQLIQLWRQLRSTSPMDNPTLTFVRPDGTSVLLEGDANLPLRNPDRVVIGLRDVTQRVAEAHRLDRARERFRLAFHGAPTGMALSSAVGGTILDVNDSFVRILGRSRDDLVGRTMEEISHPDDWQRTATLLRRAGDHDVDNYRVEKRYLRGDGGVVWARTSVSVMDDGEGGT
ncbi:MAG: PAS domain-containing protein, partial [Actinomycetota bacterium]